MRTTVVNISKKGTNCDVRIDRVSRWGSPFKINRRMKDQEKAREEMIEKYRAWILAQPQLLAELYTLRGKTLGCHCKPLPCHGDVLVELIENMDQKKATPGGRTS